MAYKNTHKIDFNFKLFVIYSGCLLFIIAVSLLVPVGTAGLIAGGKQWGVRFLLIIVPIAILVTLAEFKNIKTKATKFTYNIALITIIALGIIGINTNTVQAIKVLDKNNQATQPAVIYLRESKPKIVAFSDEFVGQVLEASTITKAETATNSKIFFNVPTESAIIKLSQALTNQQINNFTYICYPHRRCDLPQTKSENLQFTQDSQQY